MMQDLRSSLLRSEVKKSIPSHLRLRARIFLLAAVFLSLLLSPTGTAFAGSATWNLNPGNGDWNTATNWMPPTVPNGPSDTATFGVSNMTDVSLSGNIEVNGIVFNPGASAFTMDASTMFPLLTISGVGITNNSGITQNFGAGLNIAFENTASAGTSTFFTHNCTFNGSSSAGTATFSIDGAELLFINTSSAASGTFFTLGSPTLPLGEIFFVGESTAGNGTFTTSSSPVTDGLGGQIVFAEVATAADGIFFTNGGAFSGLNAAALTSFEEDSTAGNSTLIASSGSGVGGGILFWNDSTGGTARLKVFGNGNLDISLHNVPGVTTGSLEGDGIVFLGANNLTIGSNNLSTTFSGLIQDGGRNGGTEGSFTKIGTDTLTLTNANTYTGGTTIEGGRLWVNNMNGSGTGSGAVHVNAGRLGGRGTIAGAVTIGTGSGAGAVLAPGESTHKAGTLTIQSTLTFNSDATYKFELKTMRAIADKVIANGVTISGARVSFVSCGSSALPPGTVFTVIDNTAATPIAGTFSNLADGSTLVADGNTFRVSYEGGTGNDLTLTVVP
jgi:autotransporter-associated beta strand protein